ncbi:MAG: YifB family Mg chelatase-like AAA ATPase [Desulfobacteraceae bacterium]|nr:YifB family Mg chelatase-like AAA ATPase [Desulfobacteraceae bacterium]
MLSKVFTGAVMGIDGLIMEVEVDIARGLPAFSTVGLPEAAVRESRERVKSAVVNCGYEFPDDRITVNLAPANIKKEGTGFDLPIAMGILSASGVVPMQTENPYLLLGELALDGRIKPVSGCLPVAAAAKEAGFSGILVPHENRREAAVVEELPVYSVSGLSEAVEFMRGQLDIPSQPHETFHDPETEAETGMEADFSEVAGQAHVKRALEIAAAGAHNLLMIGPPGSGKTMLARRFAGIVPPMTFEESLETTKIFSVSGLLEKDRAFVISRPFRAPHHTVSDAGLIGGGSVPRPGEVSLAHNGVLFLDELPEFKKSVLEVLRQPIEQRRVIISRASVSLSYPSDFTLIAALNPCPCG